MLRPFVFLSSVLILGGCSRPSAPARPDVILITLDTTRPDFLSCYNKRRPSVPGSGLERLAATGALCTNALASSGVTPVSHATILTGRHPFQHGLRVLSAKSGFRLPPEQTTIAGTLRAQGYRTAAIHSAFPVSGYFGFERDYDHFDSFDGALEQKPDQQKTSWDEDLQRRSDETIDRALACLDDAPAGQPVFLWIHLWDPHDPTILPPSEYLSHIQGLAGADAQAANSLLYEEVYAAEVRFMDQQIGELLDGLAARERLANTLVCVTADHGEGLSDGFRRHGWGKHRMNYQEQIHVPLVFHGPSIAPAVVSDLVRSVDIVPTLLDYAGLAHADYAGRSLRPLLEGRTLPPVLAYADQINGYDLNASMVAQRPDAAFLYTVTDGVWKLIYRPHMSEASELFHLGRDPLEEHNLIATEQAEYLRLMAELAHWNPWVLAPFPDSGQASGAADALFNELGYTGGDEEAGELEWWWTCPAHEDYSRATRHAEPAGDQHGIDGCTEPVVPRCNWPR